jgi:hypothetical protein
MRGAAIEAPAAGTLIADALANPINAAILDRLPRLGLDQP